MNFQYLKKKLFLLLYEKIAFGKQRLFRLSYHAILLLSFFGMFLMIAEVGYETDALRREWYNQMIIYVIDLLMFMYFIQVLMVLLPGKPKVSRWNMIIKIVLLALLSIHLFDVLPDDLSLARHSGYRAEWLFNYALLSMIFVRSWSRLLKGLYSSNLQGEKMFVFSFIFLIIGGTSFLLLPVSTVEPISFTDALFTSTSAVCVTGLTTLDTATQFTWFGKMVIMILIQFGGIGIMTFTSFFASVGSSEHSLTEGTALSSMVMSKNLKRLFSALYAVILVTIGVELLGATVLYFQLPASAFPDNMSRFIFALFHSVSAFCNAGFSIAPNGMMNEVFDKAYGIQMTIALLIVIGGLGFFIITNYAERFVLGINNFIRKYIKHADKIYEPNLVNINSRLVVTTTFWLLAIGTSLFMIFEYNGVLSNLSLSEKLMTSFFSAVTPRTAGFNTLDFSTLALPTIMLTVLMMWIGASPGSTGGGIKTTSFALAILNAFSIGRGKERIHYHNREISNSSVRKAFLIITFSIVSIMIATMLLSFYEPDVQLRSLLFEAFSAFGTVGLSLNLTATLSEPSKYILIFLMFLGRIGIITLFVAFVRKTRYLLFSYPEEDVFI